MIVEKQMECRLAGEIEVLGENLPQRYFSLNTRLLQDIKPIFTISVLISGCYRISGHYSQVLRKYPVTVDHLAIVYMFCFSIRVV
jgi:hypothetical protein